MTDNQFYIDKLHARIEQLEERMRGADALIVLWETRATRAEARVEKLEQHKRLQTEDVMKLGAQLGQAWLRIEQALREINEAVLAEREACAAIASKHNHHSGLEIAELILDQTSPPKALHWPEDFT
jgi:predicted  nucleic acid-binding Zn-ribbon protein